MRSPRPAATRMSPTVTAPIPTATARPTAGNSTSTAARTRRRACGAWRVLKVPGTRRKCSERPTSLATPRNMPVPIRATPTATARRSTRIIPAMTPDGSTSSSRPIPTIPTPTVTEFSTASKEWRGWEHSRPPATPTFSARKIPVCPLSTEPRPIPSPPACAAAA